MDKDRLNSEGYPDPTAYEALKSVSYFRPVVYICSPYAGDIEGNVLKAKYYCRVAAERGFIPIAVHLLFPQFLKDSDPDERNLGIFFGKAIMSKCAEVWVCGDYISPGMDAEIKRAQRKGYKLRYFDNSMKEVIPDA